MDGISYDSTEHYASNHGDLVIYLSEKWKYKVKNSLTESQIWGKQIIEINDPSNVKKMSNLDDREGGANIP